MICNKTFHAFTDDVLGELDGIGVAQLVRRKEVTPDEIVQAAIARARAMEPHINAIETAFFKRALARADTSPRGYFSGVPTFIKDNTDLKGVPSNHGSKAVNSPPAKNDSAFIKQYLSLGFVPLGKSALPEFGFNASTEYVGSAATCNPWHVDYSCGASSGGSAALVASGVVPLAHANDGGGSIRIPAACCGLIGLKPTRGRLVDSEAAKGLPIKIVSEGVLTRSVRDTAYFYYGAEQYYKNKKLPAIGLVGGAASKKLRIGLVLDSITGYKSCAETRAVVAETARLFEAMGHHVEAMQLPVTERFAEDFSIYWGMLSFLISVFGKKAIDPSFDASKLDSLSKGLSSYYKKHFNKTLLVLYRLHRTYKQTAKIFEHYDIVLSPVLAHTTPRLGYLTPDQDFDQLFDRLLKYVSFTPLNNAAGSPAISLPMGTSTDGLPIGVHLSAAHGGERTLLEIAFALEEAKPWKKIQDIVVAT